jgi:HD-like signal output (HDOD) protein
LHAERVFVMGVIHNVGQLVICQYLPDSAREILFIADNDHELLNAAEQDILAYTHQDVGLALLRRWGLPPSVCQAAGYHHQPDAAESAELEVAIVHVAGQLLDGKALGLDAAATLERIHPFARSLLQVNSDLLDEVRAEGEGQIEEVAGRFIDASPAGRRPAH